MPLPPNLTGEQRRELAAQLREIADRVADGRQHACAGWDCATCSPARNAEDIRQVANQLAEEE